MINENPISVRNARLAHLWDRANRYVLDYLPGKGLDCVYQGVQAQDGVCLAIFDWIQTVWALYYVKREQIPETEDVPDDFFNFDSCGEMPAPVVEDV